MKRLTPHSTSWHKVPHREITRSRAQRGRTNYGPYCIDLHKKESQICIVAKGGELIEHRIRTEPRRFAEALGERASARVLFESSTESEWVARCLEALGHHVVVADPSFAPMYATLTHKVKTDRGMPARWPRPVCWVRTGLRTGRPMHNAMSGRASGAVIPRSDRGTNLSALETPPIAHSRRASTSVVAGPRLEPATGREMSHGTLPCMFQSRQLSARCSGENLAELLAKTWS